VQSNRYTIAFAFTVCVILSVLLSATYMSLKDRQELNRKLDRQKNILIAAGFSPENADDVGKLFLTRVKPMVLSLGGNVVLGKLPEQIISEESQNLFPLFRISKADNEEETESFVYPIEGKGLWSTMYGYLAVDPNGKIVKGITFYKQGETPGLGGEIEKEWFRKNFIGKKLYDGDKLVGINVAKGKARDQAAYKTKSQHMVDGISGATLTCNGITKMLKINPKKYGLFFRQLRRIEL